jgi:hypothetical protein
MGPPRIPISFTARNAPTFDRLQTSLLAFGVVRISFAASRVTEDPLSASTCDLGTTGESRPDDNWSAGYAMRCFFSLYCASCINVVMSLQLQSISIALVCRLAKGKPPRFVDALFQIH